MERWAGDLGPGQFGAGTRIQALRAEPRTPTRSLCYLGRVTGCLRPLSVSGGTVVGGGPAWSMLRAVPGPVPRGPGACSSGLSGQVTAPQLRAADGTEHPPPVLAGPACHPQERVRFTGGNREPCERSCRSALTCTSPVSSAPPRAVPIPDTCPFCRATGCCALWVIYEMLKAILAKNLLCPCEDPAPCDVRSHHVHEGSAPTSPRTGRCKIRIPGSWPTVAGSPPAPKSPDKCVALGLF